jgi:hypothetical protein
MRRPWTYLFTCLLVLVVSGGQVGRAQAPPAYVVIVHPSNAIVSADRAFLASAFLKKTTRWPGGVAIRPADLKPGAAARARFSQEVIGRSVSAVRSYWQQVIFSGRDVPPPEFATDADVVTFVLKHPGAVGYVSGTVDLRGARPIAVK